MANTLGVYNPIFYANEALIQLEKALGMAGRVHRGFEAERNSFGRGEVINIRRPSTFTAQDAPSTAQDITTETVAITLSNWKEVKFKLTDKELAFTQERIINDHIRPAAYELANNIDSALVALYKDVGNSYNLSATPGGAVADVTGVHTKLFDSQVPMDETMLHFMVNGRMQGNLLANSAFGQWQGAGPTGEATQVRGAMGRRFGMNFFANQNVATHTSGSITTGLATKASTNQAVGTTSLICTTAASTGAIALKDGDVINIAGDSQDYVVTADATEASAATDVTLTISPALKVAVTGGEAVTLDETANTEENLAFHRNAFALVMAPLPDMAEELGARVTTVSDPVTGLSIRARIYYVGNSSEVHVALDVLYGVVTLDGQLACRARHNLS